MIPEIVGCVEARVKYRRRHVSIEAQLRVSRFEKQQAALSSQNLFDSSLLSSSAITDIHPQSSIRSPVRAKPVCAAAEQGLARSGADQPRRWGATRSSLISGSVQF